MILGIISPFPSQVNAILNQLPEDIISVTEVDILNVLGLGRFVHSDKSHILDCLLETYGNVVVSGAALWDKELTSHFNDIGGTFVSIKQYPDASEIPTEQYWESRYSQYIPTGVDVHLLMNQIRLQSSKDTKGVVNVSIEDTINKAMLELGIEPELLNAPKQPVEPVPDQSQEILPGVVEEQSAEPVPKLEIKVAPPEQEIQLIPVEELPEIVSTQPAEQSVEPLPLPVPAPEPVSEPLPVPAPEPVPEPEISVTIMAEANVYLKIKDGTIALFIPEDIHLPNQVINNISYTTLVFKAPDLGNTGLQELSITNLISKPTPRKSITNSQVSEDLADLVSRKVQLDQAIKAARADNNETLVNELRKQRRHVRRHINSIGGSHVSDN